MKQKIITELDRAVLVTVLVVVVVVENILHALVCVCVRYVAR